MVEERYVIGIDGGGSHTRCVIVRGDGHLLGFGLGGPSNPRNVDLRTAAEAIEAALDAAWRDAGLERRAAERAFLGVAGVVSEEDRAEIEAIARGLALAYDIEIDHDIRSALAGGLAGEEGIALIAGTGSSCYGRRHDGTSWRSGGWGGRVDDEGGGYRLGLASLRAVVEAIDGRGEATRLVDHVRARWECSSDDALLRRLAPEGASIAEIAALAPVVLSLARDGDAVAEVIVDRQVVELARLVEAVTSRLWRERTVSPPLVPVGGLFDDLDYRERVVHELDRRGTTVTVVSPQLPPVLGAALLALGSTWRRELVPVWTAWWQLHAVR